MRGQLLDGPAAHAVVIERIARLRFTEALEGEPAMQQAAPVGVGVLVNAPADALCLQHFRQRGPLEGGTLVCVARRGQLAAHAAAQVVDLRIVKRAVAPRLAHRGVVVGARHEGDAVRVGATGVAAVVGVAKREGLGQRVLERNVFTTVVAHRMVVLVLGPEAETALVPRILRIHEAVRRAGDAQRVDGRAVEVERRDLARAVRLVPHRLA